MLPQVCLGGKAYGMCIDVTKISLFGRENEYSMCIRLYRQEGCEATCKRRTGNEKYLYHLKIVSKLKQIKAKVWENKEHRYDIVN